MQLQPLDALVIAVGIALGALGRDLVLFLVSRRTQRVADAAPQDAGGAESVPRRPRTVSVRDAGPVEAEPKDAGPARRRDRGPRRISIAVDGVEVHTNEESRSGPRP